MVEETLNHGTPLVLTTDTVLPGPANVENASVKSNLIVTLDTKSKRPTNFGIVPLPKRLVYDPERPAHFGLLLNVVFGLSSTFSMSLETHMVTAKAFMISKYSCCQSVLLPTTVESVISFVTEKVFKTCYAVEFAKSFNVTYGEVSM
jgi:hypothetical protein